MDILNDFRSKDFMGQMQILGKIEKAGSREAIPQLLDLHAEPLTDDSISFMVQETLRAFLSKNEEETVKELLSDNLRIRKLCVQIAGENKFQSAGKNLVTLAGKAENEEILFEILTAVSAIMSTEFVDIFKKNIHHKDTLVSALSIKMLGEYMDSSSIDILCELIKESESDDNFENCSISEYKAIEALSRSGTEKTLSFLCSMIHHRNAGVRRIIHEELVNAGTAVTPFLTPYFEKDDDDMKIMAADIIGRIGDKSAVDSMVESVSRGYADHHNVRQAIYDALGRLPDPQTEECLMEGLQTGDEVLLMSAIASLNAQNSESISSRIKELIEKNDPQSEKIIKAVIKSNSLSIFEMLYQDGKIGSRMIDCITELNDPEIISGFYVQLVAIGGERAEADAEKIEYSAIHETGKKILALDSSKPMLLFYRAVAADLHVDIITAANGKEGLEKIAKDKTFDLILTEMNMPIMDGLEFSRQVKEIKELKNVPIIMATTESDQTQEQQAINSGVSCFVMKPVTPDMLQQKIKELIDLDGDL